jgi:hypothetical protein
MARFLDKAYILASPSIFVQLSIQIQVFKLSQRSIFNNPIAWRKHQRLL